jgi:hypothetical protein
MHAAPARNTAQTGTFVTVVARYGNGGGATGTLM